MKQRYIAYLLGLLAALFIMFVGYGYIHNFYDAVQTASEAVTGLWVLRVLGIFFPPLGVFMGWYV